MTRTFQKYRKNEITSDAEYWAEKTMEECLKAVCFMVEQYISWNSLPETMDKTVFAKINKHKEWAEEQEIWNSFSPEEKAMFNR